MRTKGIRRERPGERGVATVVVAMLLLLFMLFIGIGIDLGRGYIVRTTLSTAIDGAALAAARMIPQGTGPARTAANNIFNVNFPAGFLGVTNVRNPPDINFGVASDGSDLITVTSDATVPTTFMRMGGFNNLVVASSGQATRRLIDLAFVMDRSGSLNTQFSAVRTAASDFVGFFDQVNDRLALVTFSSNTIVVDAIQSPGRGFAKATVQNHITNTVANGATATAEGLYQAWDQLRRIPINNQSGLRVIVLFTDGTPNTFPAAFQVAQTCNNNSPSATFVARTGSLYSNDYPQIAGTTTTTNTPQVQGLYTTYGTTANQNITWVAPTTGTNWTSGGNANKNTLNPCIPKIPLQSSHTQRASAGIPAAFNLYDGALPHQRPLIGGDATGYPNHVQNANNVARNLMEIVANAARADTSGRSRIHIFTLGLGDLLNQGTGSDLETGSSMLKRVANDPSSLNYNANQPDGGYYYAGDVTQLHAAFEAIRDRIIRISQ